MTKFVDTHCHGLPLVDDGVQSNESALIMLNQAVESQIRLVFMTPHVILNGKFFPAKSLVDHKLSALKAQAKAHKLPIEIKLGCEITLSDDGLKFIQDKGHWPYQDTDFVLVEFIPPFEEKLIQEAIYELKRQGQTMLIAHPERYFSDPKEAIKRVTGWRKAGAFLQVNKTSILINQKSSNCIVALALIEKNLIQIIATDAHQPTGHRECRLDETHIELIRLFDKKTADCLLCENPTRLSENKPLVNTEISSNLFSIILRKIKFKLKI